MTSNEERKERDFHDFGNTVNRRFNTVLCSHFPDYSRVLVFEVV